MFDKEDSRENLLLSNVFGCNVGEKPVMNQGIGRLVKGVNPFEASAKDVYKVAATHGRKPAVSGFGTLSRVTIPALSAHRRFLNSQHSKEDVRLT